MGLKRLAENMDTASTQTRRITAKRQQLSPPAKNRSSNCNQSSSSVSEDSAVQSTRSDYTSARESSVSSVQTTVAESEPSEHTVSSSDNDSSDDHSDATNEDFMTTVGGPAKPLMNPSSILEDAQDLRARLTAFLPQLAEANKGLAGRQKIASIEDVEEGEQHIEMNLGLGVLEHRERTEGDDDSVTDFSDEESKKGESGDSLDGIQRPKNTSIPSRAPERNIMRELLRQDTPDESFGIEEIG